MTNKEKERKKKGKNEEKRGKEKMKKKEERKKMKKKEWNVLVIDSNKRILHKLCIIDRLFLDEVQGMGSFK